MVCVLPSSHPKPHSEISGVEYVNENASKQWSSVQPHSVQREPWEIRKRWGRSRKQERKEKWMWPAPLIFLLKELQGEGGTNAAERKVTCLGCSLSLAFLNGWEPREHGASASWKLQVFAICTVRVNRAGQWGPFCLTVLLPLVPNINSPSYMGSFNPGSRHVPLSLSLSVSNNSFIVIQYTYHKTHPFRAFNSVVLV